MNATRVWVVGESGLLGSSIARAIDRRPTWKPLPRRVLPWGDESFGTHAQFQANALADQISSNDRAVVIWAAGAAVTSSSNDALNRELDEFSVVLRALRKAFASEPEQLTIFYASSVGGIYGGSRNPPFNEHTEPAPISDYGRFKLQAESVLRTLSRETRIRTVIGRIANLYGPGQKLGKMQGLISQLSLAQLTPRPASIFVPLDTMRDYIYVDDCAQLILDCVDQTITHPTTDDIPSVTKIIATGAAASIAELLGHFGRLSHGHPNVMIGSSPFSALQARDLRVRSVVWPELDRRPLTPLPVGIKATLDDILMSIQRSTLATVPSNR